MSAPIPSDPAALREPLVLLHGFGLNASVWRPVIECLSAERTVLALDLPGHGADPAACGPTLADWTARLASQAPPRAVWLGWSFGAQLAIALAAASPARVSGLILVGTSPRFVAEEDWAGVAREVWDEFGEQLSCHYGETVGRFLALQMGDKTDRKIWRSLKAAVLEHGAPHPGALRDGLKLLSSTDLRAEIRQMNLPALIVQGRKDRLVPFAAAEFLAQALHAPLVEFPEAGHAPFLTDPARFCTVVEQFMENGRSHGSSR